MGQKPNWTPKEKAYLQEAWGNVSMKSICKHLSRSENAVKIMVNRIGLGAFLENGDYISLNQLSIAIGCGSIDSYNLISWVEKRGLKVRNITVRNNSFRVVAIKDFWKWAEANRAFIDFSKMEENSLGKEPDWVKSQRRLDNLKAMKYTTAPWTPGEDNRLIALLKQHRYTYLELSQQLRRTSGAIQRRVLDLGIKERPVKAESTKWSPELTEQLASLIKEGAAYPLMAEALGKSDKAIRGKVFQTYRTENLDAVLRMMGAGDWGDGAPEPTVKSDFRKSYVRADLSTLAGLLLCRRNALAFDGYWQKDMCQHWDDLKGCTKNQSECDSCTEFCRIRPQYCRRCGETFYERKENTFCTRCRTQRKKQAQRKWAIRARKAG